MEASLSEFPIQAPVCVTGATGYVASHVVRELLERGATVHATARDPENPEKVGHLLALAEKLPGTLRLFAADLMEPGSFTEALAGCEVVFHTASPFVVQAKDPAESIVAPALRGTENVLSAANVTPSVRRVVLTSSIVACQGDAREAADHGPKLDETHWNAVATVDYQPYSYSKTVAERKAWEIAGTQDRWDLVTINPGFVMGPSLTKRNDSTSIDFLLQLIDGRLKSGVFEFYSGWVDVRDVATAHVEAAIRREAAGRYLVVAETRGVWSIIDELRQDFGDRLKLPGFRMPKWSTYIVGPFIGFSWRYVSRQVDVPFDTDNTRSRDGLGLEYHPIRKTMRDHVEQLIADGLYSPT